jgi:acetylornithine deacetylase/succinyl-diaminopimelate desuccinylase-like protein
MKAPDDVQRALARRFPEHLERTRAFLRQPSVSATGEGVRECADMLRGMMEEIGCKVRMWGKDGHPVVYGDLNVGAPVTLVEYEMYDVQPVGDLDAWMSPPFAADIHELPRVGKSVVARGAMNSKGALCGNLFTWKTIQDVDELPVNLKIVAEGEEEISSANFIDFVRTHRKELKADGGIACDYGEDLRGVPTIGLGVKGCLYLTIWSRGSKAKGGPMKSEIHSSSAVWVTSPVWRLVKALETLVDENQRPAIDGLWDDVAKPSKRHLELVKELTKTFDAKTTLEEMSTAKFKYELPKEKLIAKYLFEPTVNLCGIRSGYTDHGGTKTVLPHEAYVKMDIRLVPNMTVEGTLRRLRAHLRRRGFDDLEIEVHGPYGPARTDPDSWLVGAARQALRDHGKEPEVWPSSGGTMPAFVFSEYLKVPWLYTGLGHGGRAHAPNEYATVDGMERYMHGQASLAYRAAEAARVRDR